MIILGLSDGVIHAEINCCKCAINSEAIDRSSPLHESIKITMLIEAAQIMPSHSRYRAKIVCAGIFSWDVYTLKKAAHKNWYLSECYHPN